MMMGENELGEDEQRLNTLISQTPAVIYSYRVSEGTPETTYVSKSVKDVLGFERDYFVNAQENFEECLHPDDAQGLFEKEEKLLTDEDTDKITVEYRFKDKQGTYHWLHDEQQVSVNEDGDEEVFGAWWDISERKEAEEQLKKRNQQLDNFASIVSHDLRNPLTVAQGRLEMALEECNSDHLAQINRSLERMELLIDDLLTLAQEGKAVAETSPVELQQLVDDCWETVATADATLISDTEQIIKADQNRLKQVLENLFRNAVEHGGEDVTVTVGALNEGFYIEDDGSGIPPEERDDVFEAGYSTSERGTGFGLNIVKQVVGAHDWNICLTEGSEGGARFEITGVEFATE